MLGLGVHQVRPPGHLQHGVGRGRVGVGVRVGDHQARAARHVEHGVGPARGLGSGVGSGVGLGITRHVRQAMWRTEIGLGGGEEGDTGGAACPAEEGVGGAG